MAVKVPARGEQRLNGAVGSCRLDRLVHACHPDHDYARLAELLEAHGHISIVRYDRPQETGDGLKRYANYTESVTISYSDESLPTRFQRAFGGSVCEKKPQVVGHVLRPLPRPWVWRVSYMVAHRCIVALLPYLQRLREPALNCLEFRKALDASKNSPRAPKTGPGAWPREAEWLEKFAEYHRRSKDLNRTARRK